MQAIGYRKSGPISLPDALVRLEVDPPVPGPRDLLVRVLGVSVNLVDTKVRASIAPEQGASILGYDAAGIVQAIGSDVHYFQVGDAVFYAGDLTRPGTHAELHTVDERIVGRKPQSLGFAEAAGLPLTAITAWEILFDAFALQEGAGRGDSLLVIGGAGGVGSILIQLAKQLTGLTVIATASRPETINWVHKMGADHVINHRQPLVEQVAMLGITPRYVAALTGTDQHFPDILALIQPRGQVAMIDDPGTLDIMPGKMKALSFTWEFMFTRSMYQTPDMMVQHDLLNRVSALIDDGTLISTVRQNLGQLSVATLTHAHIQQESGQVIGKNVLSGLVAT